jgi:hypothetical protein
MAAPGDRFDVKVSADGRLVLTRLVPEAKQDKPNRVRVVKRGRYHVGVTERPIDMAEVRKLLAEFP